MFVSPANKYMHKDNSRNTRKIQGRMIQISKVIYTCIFVKVKHTRIFVCMDSGVSEDVRGMRTHPPTNIKCPFSNVKCPFLPIISFYNQNTLKVFYNFTKFLHDFLK